MSNNEKKSRPKLKRALSWIFQLSIFTGVVIGIFMWQGRNLLATDELAPNFSTSTLSGKEFNLKDQVGKKTVLYFFAPWCSVCHAASHNINAIAENADPTQISLYAIGVEYSSTRELKSFASKQELIVPVLVGNDEIRRKYRVSAFPTIYIIDESGKIEHRIVGYTTEIGLRLRLL